MRVVLFEDLDECIDFWKDNYNKIFDLNSFMFPGAYKESGCYEVFRKIVNIDIPEKYPGIIFRFKKNFIG
jgi:hypothetical protein